MHRKKRNENNLQQDVQGRIIIKRKRKVDGGVEENEENNYFNGIFSLFIISN